MFLNKRGFASSLYNYGSKGNPQVYMTISKDGKSIGDLVFQLYANHCPQTTENFMSICTGSNASQLSYKGTKLDGGFPGILVSGGKITEENLAAEGRRLLDENTKLRHHKRGMITMANDGENAVGSQFMITLDNADMLDGYHVAFGELVEGDNVLKEIERGLTRHGTFNNEFRIEATGTR